ncbi:DsbA family protein [Natronoglycomyces albus]|uniref:DsbA family protein n=1 Tax=Natronoglycomyces albus TaxID=2811108 RepID=A0A895XKS6_9ACTN|nr:DsbA family protein [Natronoglycomyces albus]QSB04029.1 DsbA family protein [Natronoglycomyces albus]
MKAEFWADVVSPWAYVGKSRVDDALASFTGEDVDIVWRPLPVDSRVDSTEAARVILLARADGGSQTQHAVATALMEAWHVDERDVSSLDVVIEVAQAAGFSQASALMNSDAGQQELAEQLLRAKAIEVETSPTMTVGEQSLAGIQEESAIREFFQAAASNRELPEEVARLREADALLTKHRDPRGALLLMQPLLERFPNDGNVKQLAARAYFASAQLAKARQLASDMVDQNPADFYARLLLGRTLQRLGRVEEARSHLRLVDGFDAEGLDEEGT